LLWRYGLALYAVIVNYRASGLCFNATFLAAVFGLAASIAVVLLGTAGNCLELISTPFSTRDILWAGTLLGNELSLVLWAWVNAFTLWSCDYAYQCLYLPVTGVYVLLRIICVTFNVRRSASCAHGGSLGGLMLLLMAGGGFLLLLAIGGGVIALAFLQSSVAARVILRVTCVEQMELHSISPE